MKSVNVLLMMLLLGLTLNAQITESLPETVVIPSRLLQISKEKTTHLIFPFRILSVDRGSRDILVRKADAVENVLQIKAAKEQFNPTNLTVITGEGKLYSFMLQYCPDPWPLTLRLTKSGDSDRFDLSLASLQVPGNNEAVIKSTSANVAAFRRTIWGVADQKLGMGIKLIGLYSKENLLYAQLMITNHSHISYEVDQIRFYIKDRRQGRRTASQETEQIPLYCYGSPSIIKADSSQRMVVALSKFTIPDKRIFIIELTEKKGGRNLRLKVNNHRLMQSSML